jgi:hypothetical protein
LAREGSANCYAECLAETLRSNAIFSGEPAEVGETMIPGHARLGDALLAISIQKLAAN